MFTRSVNGSSEETENNFFKLILLSYITFQLWISKVLYFPHKFSLCLCPVLHSKTKVQSSGKPGSALEGSPHKKWRIFPNKIIQSQTHIGCVDLGLCFEALNWNSNFFSSWEMKRQLCIEAREENEMFDKKDVITTTTIYNLMFFVAFTMWACFLSCEC